MGKDIKILFAALAFTFLLIVGFSYLMGGKSEEATQVAGSNIEGLEIAPLNYELGGVPIDGGIVTREYQLKNTLDKALTLKKITTSCMCTLAKVVVGDKETKFFGMEHGMDRNPPVNIQIPAGETATTVVTFDPAAHGPEGKGPFERIIWLTFSDPAGINELKFDGEVI